LDGHSAPGTCWIIDLDTLWEQAEAPSPEVEPKRRLKELRVEKKALFEANELPLNRAKAPG